MSDLIDRQAAIDALFKLYEYQRDIDPTEAADLVRQGVYLAEKKIEQLPSAQPKKRTEKRTETHTCDYINRKDAIDALDKRFDSIPMEQTTEILLLRKDLRNLPPAQPDVLACGEGELIAQPERTGRWIDHVEDGYVECPFCHSATNCDDNISDLHFCFSCGARMEGEG